MEKQTKDEAIDLVKNSFPSIYAKEDVLKLLESVEATGALDEDAKEKLKEEIKEEIIDKIKEAVKDAVEDCSFNDHIDSSDAEFSLNGNEIQLDRVGMNENDIASEIIDNIDWDV
jgi:hypothetical protein